MLELKCVGKTFKNILTKQTQLESRKKAIIEIFKGMVLCRFYIIEICKGMVLCRF